MKKLFTIFLLCFSGVVLAQETVVKITNYNYSSSFRDRRCGETIRLTAFYVGGGEEIFVDVSNDAARNYTGGTYRLNGIVERVELYAFARDARNQGIGTTCRRGRNVEDTQSRNTPMDPCSSAFYNIVHSNSNDVSQSVNFTLDAVPVPAVSRATASDRVGFEDPLTINSSAGYNTSVYNWQYGFNGTDWFELPIPNAQNPTFTLEDFLTEAVIGNTILFRIRACNQESSNVVSYVVRKSAPHIIGQRTRDVTCYDSIDASGNGDGEIILTFDRALDPALDNVSFSVIDLRTNSPVKNVNNIDTFGPGNTFTIDGLPASTPGFGFRVDILGFYNGIEYFTEAPNHTTTFEIDRPTPVAFVGEPGNDANHVDVWCFGGSDGTIDLEAQGGVEGYEYLIRVQGEVWDETQWTAFAGRFTHTIQGLPTNTYEIRIRDANECEAKEQINVAGEIRLGDIIVKTVIIDQPSEALDVEFSLINEPRAFGFEDGRIRARIFGGTSESDGSYVFEWRDASGATLSTINTNVLPANEGYEVILHSVGEGTYTLSAWDTNFNSATDKDGCFFINASYTLEQPDPLQVQIDIYNPISCHIENEYNDGVDFNDPLGIPDQFQDGALIATVTGGVPFDKFASAVGQCRSDLRRYCYRWKKEINGVWQDIAVNDSIINNLSVGNYALNVEDSNGIVLGTYEAYNLPDGSQEYRLTQAIDSTRFLPQPDRLELSFDRTVVTCANGDDGEATVFVQGGTSPYTYEWSNGETTPTITGLIGGTYLVFITDAKGCQIEGSILIDQPNGLEITPVIERAPTCFEGNDGQIDINVTGGNPPYTYLWSTGSTGTSISGLTEGSYSIEVTDRKGCKAFYQSNLVDPDPVFVNLEPQRSLCQDQSVLLDITIDDLGAVYSWSSDNGFSSAESNVELTQAGRYIATITTSLGCIGISEINIDVFDTPIDSDFLITTQAFTGEEVILVNVSDPIGESVDWTIPDGVEVVSMTNEQLILVFEEEGAYEINLRSYQRDCYQDFMKTILVQPAIESPDPAGPQQDFIQEFIVFPNPNSGTFRTQISLEEDSNISLKIISLMSGVTLHERTEKDNRDFLLDYNVSLPTGVYLLLLETPKGSETRKLVFE
ncbi:T9SS type A sorting domain-containing protein [Aquimarina spongiae]|uniref:Por secretion system C-terminal sorting domain-containing protein n=1 Tax=Aquimarina spongiae TaxID=570521 RepID=A0A1M6ABG6_9FLAO|nr:T9SS type A sorting domain-containing protein [Aquimarina spongiae]SHI33718.1 Por secretion system C-terminal sorting domain-containing protein [Aquimarina spongiae]